VADKQATLLLRIKTAGQEAVKNLADQFDVLKTGALAALAAIGGAIIKGISEYAEQEKAVNALSRAMVNNGVYSKELKNSYLEQADALSKLTLFGDEQIVQAQAAFSQQAKGVTLTKEATSAILDFAQAQGMDAGRQGRQPPRWHTAHRSCRRPSLVPRHCHRLPSLAAALR